MGTDDEKLPSIEVGHNSFCRKSLIEGAWLYYAAMPLNYIKTSLTEFKNMDYAHALTSNSYEIDRTRYLYYNTGVRPLYWGNKPIKNHAYVCRCIGREYDDSKDINSYTTADIPLVGGKRKVNYDIFLRLMDETESLMPASIEGGWPRMVEINCWTRREGHNSSGHKHKTKAKRNYELTGGYKIGSFDITKAKDPDDVREICISSLGIHDPNKLGKLKPGISTSDELSEITESDMATYVSKNNEDPQLGITVYNEEIAPPNLSFIPLMRI